MSASMNVIDNISIDSHMLALQRIARKQDGRIQIGQNEIAVPFVYEINTNSQLSEISWARERPPCAIVSRVSGDDSEHSDSTFGYNNVCVKGCGMPDVEMWKSDSRPGQRKKSNKSKVENADIRKNRKSSNRKDVPSDMVSKSPGEIVNALLPEEHAEEREPHQLEYRPVAYLQQAVRYSDTSLNVNHLTSESRFTEKHQPSETICRPHVLYNHSSTDNTFTEKHQPNETNCRPHLHYNHFSTENTCMEKHQPNEIKCRPNMRYNHIPTENSFKEKHQPYETKCRPKMHSNHIPTENTFTEKHQQKHQPNETLCRPNMHYNHISTENTFTEKHQQKHQPNETLCRPHKYEGSCMFSSSEASSTTSSPPKYNRTSIETTFHKNLLKRTLFKTDEVHLLGNKNDTTKLTKPPRLSLVNANQGINSSPSCFESIWTSKLTFKQTEDNSHRATEVEGQEVNESIKSLDNSGAYNSSETLEIGIKPEVSEKCYHRLKSKNYEDFSIYFKAKGEQGQVINPSNATIPSHQPVDEAEYHVSATEERPDNPKAIRFTPIYAETNFRAVERVVKPEAKRLDSCARRADGFRVHGPTGDSLWNRINTDNNQRINGPTNYFSLKHHDRKILLEGSGDFPGGLALENTKKDSQETENAPGVNHSKYLERRNEMPFFVCGKLVPKTRFLIHPSQ